jgi:hypothetical protein
VKIDPSTPPVDASAIQAVTPSDVFSWPRPAVAPQPSQPIENKTALTLYFDHERPEVTEGKEPPLTISLEKPQEKPNDP